MIPQNGCVCSLFEAALHAAQLCIFVTRIILLYLFWCLVVALILSGPIFVPIHCLVNLHITGLNFLELTFVEFYVCDHLFWVLGFVPSIVRGHFHCLYIRLLHILGAYAFLLLINRWICLIAHPSSIFTYKCSLWTLLIEQVTKFYLIVWSWHSLSGVRLPSIWPFLFLLLVETGDWISSIVKGIRSSSFVWK